MALENYPTTPTDVCWTVEGYKGKQDFAELFLGDRYITVKAEASLSALFTTNSSLINFLSWWEEATNEGALTFVIGDITIFGKRASYVVKQISEFKHDHLYKTLSFDVQINYDSDDVGNEVPIVLDVDYSIETNTQNNNIVLSGYDAENDELTFEVLTQPTTGVLTGVAPNLFYTPDTDYEGADSFTYVAKDIFNYSNEATVTLAVGIGTLAGAKFEYNVMDDLYISGNYHYDDGSGNITRGTGGVVEIANIPVPNGFVGRVSTATYVDAGVLLYAAIDEERIQDGFPLYERESTNSFLHSNDLLDVAWLTSGTLAVATNAALTPDGILTCHRVYTTDDTLSSLYQLFDNDAIDRTTSFWVKSNGAGGDSFQLRNGTTTQDFVATASWVRYSLDVLLDGTVVGLQNNGAIMDILVCFAQTESDSPLSSYIPTTTTPITRAKDIVKYPLTIWSNDHKIVTNENVLTAKVLNWGDRLSYEDFLNGYPNITSFTIDEFAGVCQGLIFTRMFKDFPSFIRSFNTSFGQYFASMFEGCLAKGIPYFDLKNGLYFQGFLKGSDIENTQYLETLKGQYFQEFAMDSALTCMGGINTISAISTLKMFENTINLVNPDAPAQAEILSSTNQPWISVAPCIMSLTGITEDSNPVVDIAIVDGTTTATATYTVGYVDETLPMVDHVWTVTGATILSGQNTATVVVQDVIGANTQFSISCLVTDSVGSIDTGDFLFTYVVNYTYLQLELPKQYDLLNLETYIDANNPLVKTEVLIKNIITNGPIESGDLTGMNVKLVNTGHLQGYNTGSYIDAALVRNNGLSVTTAFVLDNSSGTISGCGGYGGLGGKGADTTFEGVTETIEIENTGKLTTQQSYTLPSHITSVTIDIIGGGGAGAQRTDDAFNDRCGGGDRGGVANGTYAVTGGQTIYFTLGVGGRSRWCSAGCDGYSGSGSTFGTTIAEGDLSVGGGRGGSVHGSYGTVHFEGNGTARTIAGLSVRDGYLYDVPGYGWRQWGGQAGFANGGNAAQAGSKGSGGGGGNRDDSGNALNGGHGTIRITYVKYLTGGDGGAGGAGAGYDAFATGQTGAAGELSNPTGGNSGGDGGTGGNFGIGGITGDTGDGPGDAGEAGKTAGKAVTGSATLKAGSLLGTTNGGIT